MDNSKTWPERIWLQHGDEEGVPDFNKAYHGDDGITWCQDSVEPHNVEYVRADLASPLPQSALSSVDAQKVRNEALEDCMVSELIAIAQYLRGVQHWEAQAGATRLAEIAKKLIDSGALQSQSLPSAGKDAEDARRLDNIESLLWSESVGNGIVLFPCTDQQGNRKIAIIDLGDEDGSNLGEELTGSLSSLRAAIDAAMQKSAAMAQRENR